MLEYTDADTSDLFSDLGRGDATAWQLYGAVGTIDKIENATTDYLLFHLPSDVIALSPKTSEMALVFRNVRPGAVRTGSTFSSGNVASLAFRNLDGSEVVALNIDAPSTIKFSGLAPGLWKTSFVARNTTKVATGNVEVGVTGDFEASSSERGVMVLKREPKQ